MTRYLFPVAYGLLTLTGTLHFIIDVVAQYARGVRPPGPATTLYWGLNASFALGQVLLGVLGFWLARRAPELARSAPAVAVSLLAAAGWLAIACVYMEYWPPRINAALFGALILAAALT